MERSTRFRRALARLRRLTANIGKIYLCVNNQNALLSLFGGMTGGREHLKECLEDVKSLQYRGCEIKVKWTLSHQNIKGNDQADELAKEGLTLKQNCRWTRSTLNRARSQPRRILYQAWATTSTGSKTFGAPFPPTAHIPRHAVVTIVQLHYELISLDANQTRDRPLCPCHGQTGGSKQIVLHCPIWSEARKQLGSSINGLFTWYNITGKNINFKNMLRFMMVTGLAKWATIVISEEDPRNHDYKLRTDI